MGAPEKGPQQATHLGHRDLMPKGHEPPWGPWGRQSGHQVYLVTPKSELWVAHDRPSVSIWVPTVTDASPGCALWAATPPPGAVGTAPGGRGPS